MDRKTVLITGCSPGGIGHSLALQFHARNYHVIATARSSTNLTHLSDKGISTLSLTVDSEESIQTLLPQVESLCPNGLDFLINNAGVNLTLPALDVDMADARRCFETNFFSVVRLVQVFAPLLTRAKGTIVMIGSLGSEMPYVFGSVYNASKAAVKSYADTLRVEMAPFDVKVITVITGGVRSQLTGKVQRYIPEQSVYGPVEEQFNRRKTHSADVGMDVDKYATRVVRQLVPEDGGVWPWRLFMRDARRRWIWAGSGSTLVWLLSGGWLWHGLFDWHFTRQFKLNLLRQKSKDV